MLLMTRGLSSKRLLVPCTRRGRLRSGSGTFSSSNCTVYQLLLICQAALPLLFAHHPLQTHSSPTLISGEHLCKVTRQCGVVSTCHSVCNNHIHRTLSILNININSSPGQWLWNRHNPRRQEQLHIIHHQGTLWCYRLRTEHKFTASRGWWKWKAKQPIGTQENKLKIDILNADFWTHIFANKHFILFIMFNLV